jgi:hypothetical protein
MQRDASNFGNTQRAIAVVVGGAGFIVTVVGGYYSVRAIVKQAESDPHCIGGVCDARGNAYRAESDDAGRTATIALGVGASTLLAAIVLYATAPSAPAPHAAGRVRAAPWVDARARGAGLGLQGSW